MTLIPKFNAYSYQANCLIENEILSIEEIKNNYNQQTQDRNSTYGDNVQREAIHNSSFYMDMNNLIFLNQSKEDIIENYFGIKEINYSWNISVDWAGYNRDEVEGWNGTHSLQDSNSVKQILGTRENDVISYLTPTERICPNWNATSILDPVQDENDYRYKNTNFIIKTVQVRNPALSVENYGQDGYGFNLGFAPQFNLGNPPVYSGQHLHIGNLLGFRQVGSQGNLYNPFYGQIPITIKNKEIDYAGYVYASGTLGQDMNINNVTGSMNIEIVRYEFEQ